MRAEEKKESKGQEKGSWPEEKNALGLTLLISGEVAPEIGSYQEVASFGGREKEASIK